MLEDDGVTMSYQAGSAATTKIGLDVTPNAVTISIGASSGSFKGQAVQRAYQLIIF